MKFLLVRYLTKKTFLSVMLKSFLNKVSQIYSRSLNKEHARLRHSVWSCHPDTSRIQSSLPTPHPLAVTHSPWAWIKRQRPLWRGHLLLRKKLYQKDFCYGNLRFLCSLFKCLEQSQRPLTKRHQTWNKQLADNLILIKQIWHYLSQMPKVVRWVPEEI